MIEAGLLPLFAWLSPAFPTGAYAYSHGLEWAAEAGDVRDEPTLREWLADLLAEGLGLSASEIGRLHDGGIVAGAEGR